MTFYLNISIRHSILQFLALMSEDLLNLISPVYRGIKIAISRPHQLDEWFSILATTLNFGLKLSSTASLYTSAHIESLTNLAKYITQIIQQLTQTLVGTIAPSISDDGFTFADEQSTKALLIKVDDLDQRKVIILMKNRLL